MELFKKLLLWIIGTLVLIAVDFIGGYFRTSLSGARQILHLFAFLAVLAAIFVWMLKILMRAGSAENSKNNEK
ncbi:hypothetical protein RQN30_07870 [Arcanobacterium hippocoleae]